MNNAALTLPQEYVPSPMTVPKDDIYAAIRAIGSGLDYARECLSTHDTNLGRTTIKNKRYAELMEFDIRQMETTLADLKEIKVNP